VLIHVSSVEEGQTKPFEAVKAEIGAEAKADKLARDPAIKHQLEDLFRKVEDQRIAGKSLVEAAQAAGLTALVFETLDRNGTDSKGGKLSVPGGTDMMNAIFASDIGLDNEPVQQKDGGHIWFEINAVEPAREKSFEDVQAEVKARVIADKKGRALNELADGLLKRIDNISTMRAVATELNLPIQSVAGLKRGARDAVLGSTGVERAFSGAIGKAVSAAAPDGVGRLILLPIGTKLPPYSPEEDAKSGFGKQLSQSMGEDLMAQYTAVLRKDLGVSINQTLLNQALGQSTP
jgi:peptidyl-prolyl cis-trans isomerase D